MSPAERAAAVMFAGYCVVMLCFIAALILACAGVL